MEAMQEIYPDIERQVMPFIRRGAYRLSGKVVGDVDIGDVIQYGREVTWKALQKYDVNQSHGDLDRYVARCLRNAYASLLAKMMAQRRMPRVHQRVGEGYKLRPLPPVMASAVEGIWEWHADTGWTLDPERVLCEEDDDREFDDEMEEIRAELDERQSFVLDVMLNPPPELMTISVEMGGNVNGPPMQIAIVRWLDPLLTKNQIDNTLNKIRQVILAHVERGGFSASFAKTVCRRWTSQGTKRRCETG